MDLNRTSVVTRTLTSFPSRRDVLRGLASAGLGLGLACLPQVAAAKKRKKPKRPMPKRSKPNAFGCLNVGVVCKNAGQCCSGICEGKKGKRACRAHGSGTCVQTIASFCDPENPTIALCNSDVCVCIRTTAGSNICADTQGQGCADCKKDADCEALGFPAGSACAPWSTGQCADDCEEIGMACVVPCGDEPPDPE